MPETSVSADNISELRGLFAEFPGRCPVRMVVSVPGMAEVEMSMPESVRLDPTDSLIDRIEQVFGRGVVQFR